MRRLPPNRSFNRTVSGMRPSAHAGTAVTMPIILNAARIEFRKLGRPINESELRWQGAVA